MSVFAPAYAKSSTVFGEGFIQPLLEDLSQKNPLIYRHIKWLRSFSESNPNLAKMVTVLESIGLTLSIGGIYPLSKGIEINKKINAYNFFANLIRKSKPSDFPQEIEIKTPHETFNERMYFIIRDGVLFCKYKPEYKSDANNCWKPIYVGCYKEFKLPEEVTVDANCLCVISQKKVYYMKLYQTDHPEKDLAGKDGFNPWFSLPVVSTIFNFFNDKIKVPNNVVSLSISNRGYYTNYSYTDPINVTHENGTETTSLFALKDDDSIVYADPWLPFGFNYSVPALPSSFKPTAMSASASTIFVIGLNKETQATQAYKIIYDFDISGKNPLLKYTSDKKNTDVNKWYIPFNGWEEVSIDELQNEVISHKNITVFQTGPGQNARELRIEGEKFGRKGYFYTAIDPIDWNFKESQ